MKLPTTMKASYLLRPTVLELRDTPIPSARSGEVLVRIEAVGSCGSDTHFYKTGAIGDLVVEGPIILGHEAAGTIVQVGKNVDESRLGELVSIEPQKPCRSCLYCKRGDYHLCPKMEFYGAWPIDGAFAEYAVIDSGFAYAVPGHMSAEQAALVEPVSVAVHACRQAGVTAGSSVFVTGAGPIGIMITQVAKAFGAIRLVVSDPSSPRRNFVLGKGATSTVDPTEDDLSLLHDQFDVYIDASGNSGAIHSALSVIKRGGRAVLVGMGSDELTIPFGYLQQREITISGTFRYVNTWPTAIELVANGAISTEGIVTSRHGLDDVENALLNATVNPDAIKSMITPFGGLRG
jgi:L-iditol 2-dehydrogenase